MKPFLTLDTENFHSSLYRASTHISLLENTYYIAGYNQDTLNYVKVTGIIWSEGEKDDNGDTVVVEWSATLGDYEPGRTFFARTVGHEGLVKHTQVIDFVLGLIAGNTIPETDSVISEERLTIKSQVPFSK